VAPPSLVDLRRSAGVTLGRATGPHAMAQVVVVPIILFLSSNAFGAGIFQNSGAWTEPIAVVSMSAAIAWTFFSVAGFIINRAFRGPSAWRVGAVLGVYAATEVLRISAVYGLASPAIIAEDFGALFRSTAAATTGIVLLGLASVAVGDFRGYRERYVAHSERLRGLAAVLRETESRVQLARKQLAINIRRSLTLNVSDAFRDGSALGRQPEDIASDLFRISDELVRPLSHGLSHDAPAALPFTLPREAPRVPLSTFLDDVSSAAPFQPGPLVLIFGLITAPTLILFTGPQAFGLWALFLVLTGATAFLGKTFVGPYLRRIPAVLRLLIITPLFQAPFVFFIATVVVPGLGGPDGAIATLMYGAVLGAILGWLPGAAEGLQFSRQRFVDELGTMDERLAWFQVRAQSQLWLDQKRLAMTLHTDVQGTILAAAMRLKNALAEGPDAAQRVIPAVHKAITKSLQLEYAGARPVTLISVVAAVNSTWSTLTSLTLSAAPDVTQAIERDPLALEVVSELIKELHLNSFKHGRATECAVELTWGQSDTVTITMKNNGSPLEPRISGEGGLGDSFLSSVTLTSSITDGAGGVVVEMTIPIARA